MTKDQGVAGVTKVVPRSIRVNSSCENMNVHEVALALLLQACDTPGAVLKNNGIIGPDRQHNHQVI